MTDKNRKKLISFIAAVILAVYSFSLFTVFADSKTDEDNGRVNGENYKEYALIRLDGEYWEPEGNYNNNLMVHKRDSFPGWNKWKEACKEGIDSSISFTREGYTITATTENLGIYIKDVLTVIDENEPVYVALTGDQVALTNIRISVDPGSKSRGTEILDDVRE